MPLGLIELVGSDIFCSVAGGGAESRFALADALPRLGQWSRRYETAAARDREGDLAAIGQEMFGWLDEAGWASGWAAGSGDRELEVRVAGAGGADQAALLDAPWELLAGREGPLRRTRCGCLWWRGGWAGRSRRPSRSTATYG